MLFSLSPSPLTDSRLHALLLVPETQPEVQAQAADQQQHQSRESRHAEDVFHLQDTTLFDFIP